MVDEQTIKDAIKSIVEHDEARAIAITKSFIEAGNDPMEIMTEGFIPGIGEVGDQFGRGLLFLPGLVQSADVMKKVTDLVNDALPEKKLEKPGVVVIGTVKGDIHDIGKGIVVALLRANGLIGHDIGRDVDTEKFIETAVKVEADVIGTSTLLTTTMGHQKDLEKELKKAGLRDKFKTIVGGAPVTARWAAKIGADAYAEDAQDSVVKIKALVG